MADRFRLTIAQLNPIMGDLAGNAAQAKDAWEQAKAAGATWWRCPRCSSPATTRRTCR